MSRSLIPFRTRWPSLFEDLDREFNRVFDLPGGDGGTEMTAWSPRLNLAETANEYLATVDLPGMNRDEINVELKNGDLWITGERRQESEESGQNWHRVESSFGLFRRMVRLGNVVDSEHVHAEYTDGVLRITVPKAEVAKSRKVTIKG